jgi:hypothetical protein
MLSISKSEIAEESARLISTLHIESLRLDSNQLSPSAALALCDCRTLQHFYWYKAEVSPKFMRALARLPLTELSLPDCDLSDEDIDPLTRHPSLSYVSLHNTKISDRSLATLASLPCLHSLGIRECDNLTPQGLLALKRAKTLELLMIEWEGFDRELAELIKANPHLEVLDHFGL